MPKSRIIREQNQQQKPGLPTKITIRIRSKVCRKTKSCRLPKDKRRKPKFLFKIEPV